MMNDQSSSPLGSTTPGPLDAAVEPQLSAAPPTAAKPLAITTDMLAPVERRTDFERGISYGPPLTIVLMAICVAVFILEMSLSALASKDSIIKAGALSREKVLAGEAWRLVSAIFLHGGVEHLVGNCLVLYVLGMAVEHAFGIARAGLIFLFSGICGSLLSLALTEGPSVGASGAIFGLAAAAIIFLYRHQHQFFLRDKRIAFVLLMWAIYTVATGILSPQVDNFCHIGGFIGGAIIGAILPGRRRPELSEPQQQ